MSSEPPFRHAPAQSGMEPDDEKPTAPHDDPATGDWRDRHAEMIWRRERREAEERG